MPSYLPEEKLIHVNAIGRHVFSTLLNIAGTDRLFLSDSEKTMLSCLNNRLIGAVDMLQIAYIMKEQLMVMPAFSDFMMVELDHTNKLIKELITGGKAVNIVRYRLKELTTFPDDDLFTRFLSEEVSREYTREEVLQSPWLSEQLKNHINAGMEKMLVTFTGSGHEYTGLLFLFSKEKEICTSLNLVNAIAKNIAAAASCLKVIDKLKGTDYRQEEDLARKEILDREIEKSILIDISNEMSAIRNKGDLLYVLHEHLKKIFDFSHTLTTLSDATQRTYTGLIFDTFSKSKFEHPDYLRICRKTYSWDDPVMKLVFASKEPVVFDLDELVKTQEVPEWVKMNYDCGIREVVMTILNSGNRHIGAFVIFSVEKGRFLTRELNLIRGISSQLSNAVANILANEEIIEREDEKSILLSLSNDVGLIRNKPDLLNFMKQKLKKVLPISHFLICIMSDDEASYTSYLLDPDSGCKEHKDYSRIVKQTITINDGIADGVFQSDQPEVFDLEELVSRAYTPEYLRMNYECGMKEAVFTALSIGGRKTGLLIIFTDTSKDYDLNRLRLIRGVSSQLSAAVTNIIANEKIERQVIEITDYKHQLESVNWYLQEEIQTTHNFSEIIGVSNEMNKIYQLVSQVADSNSSVLILGETGTGKELIARAIHNSSSRRDKAMVKINCAALPASLIESELFGHERGSFTGATERRIGKFELANNSTLFLDEVGELPLDMQSKLLRALQEKEIERVGGKAVIKVNVRIIAATNRDLLREVKAGTFRSDLYFRLNVFPITIPPLRERREDIPLLASHFLTKHGRKGSKEVMHFSSRVMKELMAYRWPGNVRELEHMIERSVLLTNGLTIKEMSFPISDQEEMNEILPDTAIKTIDEIERDHIMMVLKKTRGKISGIGGAAEILKIPATTLGSKIIKLNIKKYAEN